MDPFDSAPVAELVAALRGDDLEPRIRAACALGDRLRFSRLDALPLDAMALLVAIVEDGSQGWPDLRFEAAITLCEARHPGGRALLSSLSDPRRRFDAIKALGRVADDDDVKIVLRRIANGFLVAWTDKLAASAVLSSVGDVEGGRYFENRLSSKWFFSKRALAIHLLGDIRHPKALERLCALSEKGGRDERGVAIRALGHLGDARARPCVERAMNEDALKEDVAYALDLLSEAEHRAA